MKAAVPDLRDIVLIGGGHSHVQVVKRFAMRAEPGIRLTLINQDYQTPYSGMLPGYVAGDYQVNEINIQLAPLCNFAGARLLVDTVIGLDVQARKVLFAGRPPVHYDILSINTGALPIPPTPNAATVKPINGFVHKWQGFCQEVELHAGKALNLVIVGAGAGGFELALAARRTLPVSVSITLIGPVLLQGHSEGARKLALERLADAGVRFCQDRVMRESPGVVTLATGTSVAADKVFWVTGVRAPQWLTDAGLNTDELGFVRVNQFLQSVSHAEIFAAGDVAHLEGQSRPKSGVYAVRAGPVLAENLNAAVQNLPLRRFRAQNKHLALLGLADGTALASRGKWAFSGRALWRLKQWIDVKFMNNFNNLPTMPEEEFEVSGSLADDLPAQHMRCGGCGAKLAADPLRRVLARLPEQPGVGVTLGMGDDAAVISNNSGSTMLTIDGFRAMLDDPYLFGRIVAHHSMNDIFAMGAKPVAGLAFVTLPLMSAALMEEELLQVLTGVVNVLNTHGASLVGGHTAEGHELSLGLTVTGESSAMIRAKSGAQIGDALILCKPLGTGVVLASGMQGKAGAQALRTVVASMDQSNAPAADVFNQFNAHALTDVTGFGLVGHLGEMLRASNVGARLSLSKIPVFPQALELIAAIESSLQSANEQALADFILGQGVMPDDPRLRLLADPQTSGGLLGAIASDQAEACVTALVERGYTACTVGEVTQKWEIVQ